ncbi:serine threonine kinase [Fusarium beomiforme]|uniref:Serine threonine kinase n=1 Tax=Fusarium beomiforme TaxID=44412 RepID=A0A9P5DRV2_9HYPO|nr:serine threonine kinase [Fusarium beomiforme]
MLGSIVELQSSFGRTSTLGCAIQVGSDYYGITTMHAFQEAEFIEGDDVETDTDLDSLINDSTNLEVTAISQPLLRRWDTTYDGNNFMQSCEGNGHFSDVEYEDLSEDDQSDSDDVGDLLLDVSGFSKDSSLVNIDPGRSQEMCAFLPAPEQVGKTTELDLDWALIKLPDPKDFGLNAFFPPTALAEPVVLSEVARVRPKHETPVFIITSGATPQRGFLEPGISLLGGISGKTPSELWTVILCDDCRLKKGDSGSVVVDASSYTVYGHVVGSNPMGEVYVSPYHGIFQQIERHFPGNTVGLLRQYPTPQQSPLPERRTAQRTGDIPSLSEDMDNRGSIVPPSSVEQIPPSWHHDGVKVHDELRLTLPLRPNGLIPTTAHRGERRASSAPTSPAPSCASDFHEFVRENLVNGVNGEGDEVPYIAPSILKNYWTSQRIDTILNSQHPPVAQSPEMIIGNFTRVFSILVHIGQPQEISWFCTSLEGLDDCQLPFEEVCFPPSCIWAEDFLREQWIFSPLAIIEGNMFHRLLPSKTILPVTYRKQLTQKRSGRNTVTLWEVQVHLRRNLDMPEDQPVVFKVYDGPGAENLYEAEINVYLKLCARDSKYITKHFASFSFQGKSKYIIVLEYAAGGSLRNFLQKTSPPVSSDEIQLLWSRLVKLLDALHALRDVQRLGVTPDRFLSGVHQDIQPANILVFPQKDMDSRFDVVFKLTDLGLAELATIPAFSGTIATENRGNRMYISPESSTNFPLQAPSDQISDLDYCIDDGSARLRAVKEFHNLALRGKRGSDNTSTYMSNIILDYILTSAHERLNTMDIQMRAETAIKNIKVGAPNAILGYSGKQPSFIRSLTGGRPIWRTAPLGFDMRLPRITLPSVLTSPTGNEFTGFPGSSIYHSLDGSSSLAQFVASKIVYSWVDMGEHATTSPLLGRKVTVDEMYRIMDKSNRFSFPSKVGMRPDWMRDIMKLPGMEEAKFKMGNSRRDQIMLIDNFRSMDQHKAKVMETATVITYFTKAADSSGIEMYAASEIHKAPLICKNSSQIEKGIMKMKTVNGTCNMRRCLDSILDRVLVGGKVKPTSIFICTDGVWEPDADQVKFVIKRAIDYLIKCEQPSSTLTFQFIRFGHDPAGTSRLKYLHNNCTKETKTEN